jgi:hypothetical protein
MRRRSGLNKGGDHQSGDDYGELELLLLPGAGAEDGLGRRDATEVDQSQRHGKEALDEGAVYEEVYLVESVAKDGYSHRDGYAHYADHHGHEADPF